MEPLSTLFPTDNLYKFLAISGLVVLGFCFIYPDIRSAELYRKVIDMQGQTEMLKVESKIQQQEDAEVTRDMNELITGFREDKKTNTKTDSVSKREKFYDEIQETVQLLKDLRKKDERDYFEFRIKYEDYIMPHQKESKELQELVKKNRVNSNSIIKKGVMIKIISDQILQENERIYKMLKLSFWGMAAGFFMSLFGFYKWYVLLQRPQDEIMRLQLEEYRQKFLSKNNEEKP